jgi:hypothetical protein
MDARARGPIIRFPPLQPTFPAGKERLPTKRFAPSYRNPRPARGIQRFMNGRRVAIVLGIVILVPLLLLGAFLVVVQSAWAERWVEARAGEALHREVQIDTIRLRLGWPPTVTFGRLRIGNPQWAATR